MKNIYFIEKKPQYAISKGYKQQTSESWYVTSQLQPRCIRGIIAACPLVGDTS